MSTTNEDSRQPDPRSRADSDVEIQYACDAPEVPEAGCLRAWANAALSGRRRPLQIVIRVVDEEEASLLNERYRGRPGPTNVLSFPFEAPPPVSSALLGDVVICAPVVQREAREQGRTVRAHWAHMVVHGALHLLGFDHQTDTQAAHMEAHESAILAALGFPDPYGDMTER